MHELQTVATCQACCAPLEGDALGTAAICTECGGSSPRKELGEPVTITWVMEQMKRLHTLVDYGVANYVSDETEEEMHGLIEKLGALAMVAIAKQFVRSSKVQTR